MNQESGKLNGGLTASKRVSARTRQRRLRRCALAIAVALSGTGTIAEPAIAYAAQAQSTLYNIPAGDLAHGLTELAQQGQIQISYAPKLVVGKVTAGVHGRYAPTSALAIILRGSGIRWEAVGPTLFVLDAADPPQSDPLQKSAPNTSAKAPTKPQAPAKSQTLQTVIVTGTRVIGMIEADSMSPIDVLTPQELRSTGAPDLVTALRTLLPSLNFPQPTGDDNSMVGLPAQLRGLSPEETLVLVNGKRYHGTSIVNTSIDTSVGRGTSPVDLSTIPIGAIARVEVLRDGAAAQYGSAAIGGVINVILKGGYQHGDAVITRSHYGRSQGHAWQADVNGGIPLGKTGWINLTANYLDQLGTNRAGLDMRYPSDPTFGTTTFIQGIPPEVQKQFAFNSQYNVGDNLTLYGFGTFSHRKLRTYDFFRSLSQYITAHPSAVSVYPEGYLPAQNQLGLDSMLALGAKGTLAGWHYDISGSTGSNHWKMNMFDSFNYALGASSPTSFYIGSTSKRENIFNGDFVRDFDIGLAAPLTAAWGVQYLQGVFTINNGDAASFIGSGTQGFSGFTPTDAGRHSRTSVAEYVDFQTQFTNALSAEVAARHERYSDFGNDTSWKLAGRYAFNPVLAIRATISTGFRAPTLQEEFYSSTTTSVVQNPTTGQSELVTVATLPVKNPVAVALGAQPLRPEKSHQYSIGVVLTPSSGITITADAYKIDIADRILLSGELTGPAVVEFLTKQGFVGVGGGQFFTNAVDTSTHGVDVFATWPITVGATEWKWTLGGNYNKTRIRSVAPNPPQLGLGGLVLPILTRTQRGLMTVNTPNSKVFLSGEWQRGNWNARAQVTRYSKWSFMSSVPSADQTYGSKVLLDASASYTLDRWRFTLGANNILNSYPDKLAFHLSSGGNLVYPESSPFGFEGAYWYANIAYRW